MTVSRTTVDNVFKFPAPLDCFSDIFITLGVFLAFFYFIKKTHYFQQNGAEGSNAW